MTAQPHCPAPPQAHPQEPAAASQGSNAGPAGLGTSVTPTGPTLTGRPVNPANPTPRTTDGSNRVPTPTSRAASSQPAQPGAPVSAYGGVARVRCDDKKAQILRLDVAAGYTIDDYRPGPADEVKAVLTSAANKSEIKVKCENGAVASQVKESPNRIGGEPR